MQQGTDHVLVIAPIAQGPFYAIRLAVGDIGTFAGLATDPGTRVLRADRQPVPGLFAVGNDAASIMGGNYPGAGITLGPAVTFGYVAGMALAHGVADAPDAKAAAGSAGPSRSAIPAEQQPVAA